MDKIIFLEQTAHLAQRACVLNSKRRKEGLSELGDDIRAEALKQNDVFELGLRFLTEGIDSAHIDKILSCMIDSENDVEQKQLKKIKKEAVINIYNGVNSLTLINALFSFLDDEEKKLIRALLKSDIFKEYFDVF